MRLRTVRPGAPGAPGVTNYRPELDMLLDSALYYTANAVERQSCKLQASNMALWSH